MSYSAEILIKRKLDEASSTKRLILMRGLPGSGKSYRAKEIHNAAGGDGKSAIFSTDDYWGEDYDFNPKLLSKAHDWNHDRTVTAMRSGVPTVIVDNTNIQKAHMEPYVQAAKDHGYEVSYEHSTAPWAWDTGECAKRNTHGVPHAAIKRMKAAYEA